MINRRIRCHNSGKMLFGSERENLSDLFKRQVWGNFDKQRFARIFRLNLPEEFTNHGPLLQFAESGGVRRTHIENKIVAERFELAKRFKIVGCRRLERYDFRFANVNTHWNLWPTLGILQYFQTCANRSCSLVIETKPVYQSFKFRNPKDPWVRIPVLRPCRNRAYLDKPKTQGFPCRERNSVLVEAGG